MAFYSITVTSTIRNSVNLRRYLRRYGFEVYVCNVVTEQIESFDQPFLMKPETINLFDDSVHRFKFFYHKNIDLPAAAYAVIEHDRSVITYTKTFYAKTH